MSPIYPKPAEEIRIQIIRREIEDGMIAPGKNLSEVSLKDKMDEYLFRLGRSNTSVWAIALQLLTKGKVQVDFRKYTERLSLVFLEDKLPTIIAAQLLEDYFNSTKEKDPNADINDITKKFTVQSPKTSKFRKK